MMRLSKDEITAALARQRALPLFNCGDVATGMQVLEALHAGGIRYVEFTNRAAGALDVFRGLVAEAAKKLPDMVLGAGTIIDSTQARAFHEAGAAFLVAPNLDEEVGAYCGQHGLFWCPGTGTVTEMIRAHRLGASVIKVFPADTLGGPAFIKGVRLAQAHALRRRNTRRGQPQGLVRRGSALRGHGIASRGCEDARRGAVFRPRRPGADAHRDPRHGIANTAARHHDRRGRRAGWIHLRNTRRCSRSTPISTSR
jgi:Entner-Doudoroff aldolase